MTADARAGLADRPVSFGPSPRRLRALEGLLWALRGLGLLSVGLVATRLRLPDAAAQSLAWLGLAAAALGLLKAGGGGLLEAARSRRVLLHGHSLELRRAGFSRFIVYEALRHVKMIQGPDEEVLALELHTDDDVVRLAGLEGLEKVFAEVAARKPAAVMVEVEERRLDLGDPAVLAGLAGAGAALLGWLLAASLGRSGELRLVGFLLLANGSLFGLWRPVSRGGGKWWQTAAEAGLGLAMAAFGWVMWVKA